MEVALSGPPTLSEPLRRGSPLPLNQLVEESRSRIVPDRLPETKIFGKLKRNRSIQSEPQELHFSGFQLKKDYVKTLKLINVSSEVLNIHILPTQTTHFQTTYTKKCRLIPGLAYVLKIKFCPKEWRYFYDSLQVQCKGEESLLIPVHAYPVIDDLHIPPHIDLSAVPLGQSKSHVIPLRCTCPIDFKFQVLVVQPHEAFSIHPLTGVIPASGEVELTVTFCPVRYETVQVTMQLVVEQFNTKPYLCTITGSSAPHSALRRLERTATDGEEVPPEHKDPPPAAPVCARKIKYKLSKEVEKSKPLPGLDIFTPGGVAKMLIQHDNKLSTKALKEAMSCGSMESLQTAQIMEALCMKRIQENMIEEQTNPHKWQVHTGKGPLSEQSRGEIMEEREIEQHDYMVKRDDEPEYDIFPIERPESFASREPREAGLPPEKAPSLPPSSGFHRESRQRALPSLLRAVHKVMTRYRAMRRLECLNKADSTWMPPSAKTAQEKLRDVEISLDKVAPFSPPAFSDAGDLLAHCNLVTVPVAAIDVEVTTRIPFFKLQVPQHYKLMGYQPVSTWDAFTSYIPTTLARPLRTGPCVVFQEEVEVSVSSTEAEAEEESEKSEVEAISLRFCAPDDLLKPVLANPLRIFNPAPGLQAYKPTPKYLESDMEFHLCPLPTYNVPVSDIRGTKPPSLHTQKKLVDRKEVIKGVMTWKNFEAVTMKCLYDQTAPITSSVPRRFVDYCTDVLPLKPPPQLSGRTGDLKTVLDKRKAEGLDSGVHLTPEMIRALFLSDETPVSHGNSTTGPSTSLS